MTIKPLMFMLLFMLMLMLLLLPLKKPTRQRVKADKQRARNKLRSHRLGNNILKI